MFALLLVLATAGFGFAGSNSVELSLGLDVDFGDGEPFTAGTPDIDVVEILLNEDAAERLQALGLLPLVLTPEKAEEIAKLQALVQFQEFFVLQGVVDEVERDVGVVRELLKIAANDPFVAFELDYHNTSEQTQVLALRGLVELLPLSASTLARNFLELELIDEDADGVASVAQNFVLGNRLQEGLAEQESTGFLFQVGNANIGDEITIGNGETLVTNGAGQVLQTIPGTSPGPIAFDTGVVAGPSGTQDDPLTTLFSTTILELSGGDRVRLRGFVGLAETAELLPSLENVLAALDSLNVGSSTTTTTSTTSSTLLGNVACGDADASGKITAADALAALRTSVDADACPLARCDADGDGAIEASDALAILRAAVGLPQVLNCLGLA